jgi:hypothetical protein
MKKLLAIAILFGALALFAVAAKPTGTSSIALDQSSPHMGDTVTFTTSVSGLHGSEWPMVYVECSQGGTVVYGALDAPEAAFQLGGGSSQWLTNGGPADCTATLFAYKLQGGETARALALIAFAAGG